MRLHSAQSGQLLGDALLDLAAAGSQRGDELFERRVVLEQLSAIKR